MAPVASMEQTLYELCSGFVQSKKECIKALEKLRQSVPKDLSINYESLLADALSIVDLETQQKQSDVRERLIKLITDCVKHKLTIEPLLMERLTDETLDKLNLINGKQLFQSRYVKLKTRLFYKQQKFNLMREENEGFAKLLVELAAMASGDQSPKDTLLHVKALIGCFDLDPHRVLDLILDACELGADNANELLEIVELYNPNIRNLCCLLGNKFQFFKGSSTPNNLYKLTAMAIKRQLVDLEQLFPLLWPSNAEMETVYKREQEEAKQYAKKIGSSLYSDGSTLDVTLDQLSTPGFRAPMPPSPFSSSSSMGAMGLGSGSLLHPSSGSGGHSSSAHHHHHQQQQQQQHNNSSNNNNSNNNSSSSADNQKSAKDDVNKLPTAIETMMGSEEAEYVHNQRLGLADALLEIGELDHARAILDHYPQYACNNVSSLNNKLCSIIHHLIEPAYTEHCTLPAVLMRHRRREFGQLTGWTLSNAAADAIKLAARVATYVGPAMCLDTVLITKLCRLCEAQLSTPNGKAIDATYQAIFNLLDECILPSLGLCEANCPLGETVWSMMKLLPYDHRYRLYGQWKEANPAMHPALVKRRAEINTKAKYIMKRLTKDNVKQLGRQLGKLSHSNPALLFDVMIEQINRYDNLVTPVVDSFRYLNSLSLDVLSYCIIDSLSSFNEESPELAILSSFVGSLCKKYTFDLIGFFQYVLNQLKGQRSCDLLLMREILHKMTGIEVSEEITDEQLDAMLGGESLRVEGGYFSQIRNTKKSSTRLKETLMEHGIVLPFVFLMAQQRDSIVFYEDEERHVKLCGRLYDNCQDVLVQFGNFLSIQLSTDEFVRQCPSIDQLINVYHVPADAAFFLLRSGFTLNINQLCDRKVKAVDKTGNSSGSDSKGDTESTTAVTAFVEASIEVTREVAEKVRALYPKKVWDDLDIEFFVTFWTLQCSDLEVPTEAYKRQMQTIAIQMKAIEDNQSMLSGRKKKEKDRCQALVDKLREEESQLQQHVARIKARIEQDKDNWFQQRGSTKTDTVTTFLQYCVFPRILFTAQDAVYSAKFIHSLHKLRAANFSTLICFDRIFNDITLPLACLTENEAHRYGRFLKALFDVIMHWHSSKEVFKSECDSFPGFVTVFRKAPDNPTAPSAKPNQLGFENYRHVVHKWHYRITKAFIACLENGNYALIRNSLLVMIRLLPHYPKIRQFGQAIERRVDKLRQEEREKRKDLEAMAISYLGLLKRRKSSWMEENEFHLKEQQQRPSAAAAAANGGTVKRTAADARAGKSASSQKSTSANNNNNSSNSNSNSQEDGHSDAKRPKQSSARKRPASQDQQQQQSSSTASQQQQQQSHSRSQSPSVDGDKRPRRDPDADAGGTGSAVKRGSSKSNSAAASPSTGRSSKLKK